mmetsp:Transcript_65138/g.108215  ORF Transcript_65138/g.108215 Transcript_65138/m.108215 type:complete len:133 (+) Transcript_65138:1-399(+)
MFKVPLNPVEYIVFNTRYRRFGQVPGGDISRLAPELKIVWQQLPPSTYVPPPNTRGTGGISSRDELENPTVNPITVSGIRSSTDVNRDEAEWHAHLEAGDVHTTYPDSSPEADPGTPPEVDEPPVQRNRRVL